jgi:hypothetical protein
MNDTQTSMRALLSAGLPVIYIYISPIATESHLRRLDNNLFIFHGSIQILSKGKRVFSSVCEHVRMKQNDSGSRNRKLTVGIGGFTYLIWRPGS